MTISHDFTPQPIAFIGAGNMTQAIIKGMDMHVTTGNNLMKLGKIVEVNTNHLNLLATKIMKLEQRIKELENDKR